MTIVVRGQGSIPPEKITFLTDDGENAVGTVNTPMDRQGNFRDGDNIDTDAEDREQLCPTTSTPTSVASASQHSR